MAASKLKMHVSPLTDQISAKFKWLYLCFLGPAFHWEAREHYVTKPEVENTNMAASKLEMHVSPLPDKISTKFQKLFLCFRGPAFRWYPREYYVTKSEVEQSNMAASILEMHVFPLPDKILTKFQRLYVCFRAPASHWDTRTYYPTKTEVDKTKMVACYLEMHVSPLQVEISTTFQRPYLCFR